MLYDIHTPEPKCSFHHNWLHHNGGDSLSNTCHLGVHILHQVQLSLVIMVVVQCITHVSLRVVKEFMREYIKKLGHHDML